MENEMKDFDEWFAIGGRQPEDCFLFGYEKGKADAAAQAWVRIESEEGETLPKAEGRFLVRLVNFRTGEIRVEIRQFADGCWSGAMYGHIRIIAWMPIPNY